MASPEIAGSPASAPTLVLQTGHGVADSILALAYSPDGASLASGCIDSSIKLWDTATGAVKATLRGQWGQIYALAYSPDGALLASSSTDGTIMLWTGEGEPVRTLRSALGEEAVPWLSVAFSPDGKYVAGSSVNQKVCLWDAATGARVKTLSAKNDRITRVAFSPDGRLLAGAGGLGIYLWDAQTWTFVRMLPQKSEQLGSIAFSPDSRSLVSASEGRKLRVWDLASGRLKYAPLDMGGNLRFVALSSDGLDVVGVEDVGTMRAWTLATGKFKREIPNMTSDQAVTAVAYSPDRHTFAAGKLWGEIDFRDAQTWKVKRTLANSRSPQAAALAASSDGRLLVVGIQGLGKDTGAGGIEIWNARAGVLQRLLRGHAHMVDGVAFSPAGKLLASKSEGELKIWDVVSGKLLWHKAGLSPQLLQFSGDGRQLVISMDAGSGVALSSMDAQTGRAVGTLSLKTPAPQSSSSGSESSLYGLNSNYSPTKLAMLPNGDLLSASEKAAGRSWTAALQLWDGKTGRMRRTLVLDTVPLDSDTGKMLLGLNQSFITRFVQGLECAPNGRTVAVGLLGKLQVWDIVSGEHLRTLNPAGMKDPDFGGFALSPDGRYVITNSGSVWDIQTGSRIKVITSFAANHSILALYSPETATGKQAGLRVAVADFEQGTVAVWNPLSGSQLATLTTLSIRADKKSTKTDWITYTPDSYYRGSPGVEAYIRWRNGNAMEPAGFHSTTFANPAVVQQRLGQ